MTEKKAFYNLENLSEEVAADYDQDQLWMLQDADHIIYGPFEVEALKDYADENQSHFENVLATDKVSEAWRPFFKIPQFQRRKPKLVPAQSLVVNEDFFLLVEAQKTGPYTLEQIKSMVETKEISVAEQISVDDGGTWIKIYEHHAFDRRTKKTNENLPFTPQENILEVVKDKSDKDIAEISTKKSEQEALIGLAFISNGNDQGQKIKKFKPKNKNTSSRKKKAAITKNSKRGFKVNPLLVASVAMLLSVYLFTDYFSGGVKTKKEITRKSSPAAKTHNRAIDNSERTYSRKPASQDKERRQKRERENQEIPRAQKFDPADREDRAPKEYRTPRRTISETHVDNKIIDVEEDQYGGLDINDPEVRAELTRELAGDTVDYPEVLNQEDIDLIEKMEREELGDDAPVIHYHEAENFE